MKTTLHACSIRPTLLLSAVALFFSSPAHARFSWAQSYGASSFYSNGTPSPDDRYYGSGYDIPRGIAKMPDGGFVVAGQIDLPELLSGHTGSNSCGTIVRYRQDGSIAWQRMLRQNNDVTDMYGLHLGYSHINAIQTDAQGNIYICGFKGVPDTTGGTPSVAKLDPSGRILWQNGINSASWPQPTPLPAIETGLTEFMTMGVTADGGVIVPSSVGKPGGGYSIPAVVKFNGDGSVGFLSALDEVGVQYQGASAICQSYDGQSYVVMIPQNGVTFVKLGLAGNILAQVSYPNDYANENPMRIIATPDNNFVALSQVSDDIAPVTYDAGVVIRKIDQKLHDKFENVIRRQNRFGGGAFTGYSLALTNDGGYLVGGYESTAQNVALMRIDSKGALVSVSLLGGPNYDAFDGCHAIQLDDGGYAFAASTLSYVGSGPAKPDWWVVKTNAQRHVLGFADTQMERSIDPTSSTGDADPAFTQKNGTRTGATTTTYTHISPDAVHPIDTLNTIFGSKRVWIGTNLATKTPPNAPYILIQAYKLPPEIVVEQPLGTSLADAGPAINFDANPDHWVKTFTVRNTGKGNLTGLAILKDGPQAKEFIVIPMPYSSLAPTKSTTFRVKFKPLATGKRAAAIHIKSNDGNEGSFDIKLTGIGVAP